MADGNLIESGVVGAREGDDELAGVLVESVDGHAALVRQFVRVHDGHQLRSRGKEKKPISSRFLLPGAADESRGETVGHLVEQVGLRAEEFGRGGLHGRLEDFGVVAGDAVPRLGLAPVQVVDRVAPVVLVVPAKGREAHADVHPRHLHARDVGVDEAQHRALEVGQVVEVPAVGGVLLVAGQQVARVDGGETRAVVHRVQVGAVLDHHVLVDRRHDAPKLGLDQLRRHQVHRHPEKVRLAVHTNTIQVFF